MENEDSMLQQHVQIKGSRKQTSIVSESSQASPHFLCHVLPYVVLKLGLGRERQALLRVSMKL